MAQLERLDEFVTIKRGMGARYTELLSGLKGLQLPLAFTNYAENIYWVYGIVLGDSIPFEAKDVISRLKTLGIGSRPFFWPMHEQPVFKKMGLFLNERHAEAERIARRGFYIPSGMGLSDDQMKRTNAGIREIIQ